MKFLTMKTFGGSPLGKLGSTRLDDENKLDEKNALNIRFINNPRKNGNSPFKLTLSSDSQLFIFANLTCINEVQAMFAKAFDN